LQVEFTYNLLNLASTIAFPPQSTESPTTVEREPLSSQPYDIDIAALTRNGAVQMTIQVDDAGVGDLLFGAIIGAHRKETGEFHYDIIPINYFQNPYFRKKLYLKKATELTLRLLQEMKLGAEEEIEICRSFVFDETREELFRKFGKEKVKAAIISGDAQRNVETAYLDEIRNLGYEPLPDRDDKRAGSFFHMLRWVKNDRRRLKYVKTGWPRLKRYIHLRQGPPNSEL